MAATIFSDMTGGWDRTWCNGGIFWKKNHQNDKGQSPYKNAIVNELFLAVAAGLYVRRKKAQPSAALLGAFEDIFNWANHEWNWFSVTSTLINSKNLINDSLTTSASPPPCRNDGTQDIWSYNQGVILGALCDMFDITGDETYLNWAEKIADAFISNTVAPKPNQNAPGISGIDANGILTEYSYPNEAIDHCQFKGIFVRNLGYLCAKTGNSKYSAFLRKNARSALTHPNPNNANQFGHQWDADFDNADFVRQTAAVDLLNACLRVQSIAPDLSYLEPLLLRG